MAKKIALIAGPLLALLIISLGFYFMGRLNLGVDLATLPDWVNMSPHHRT